MKTTLKKRISTYWASYALILVLTLFITTSFAQSRGEVIQSLKFQSQLLDTTINYTIYLPPFYGKDTTQTYPVFYLLHGYTDNETAWVNKGWVDQVADQGIIAGQVEKMIIIMPDGGLLWYLNQPNGKYNYEDMFIKELIPFIDKTYRTKPERKYRAIGGLSMGGFGALGYSMRHPTVFSACVAFSSGIRPDDETVLIPQKRFDRLYKPIYGENVQGKDRLSKHWNENNPLYLAKTLSEEQLNTTDWYISCGDDDFLFYGNIMLHKTFRDRKIKHEFRVYDGGHNWNYWRPYIGEGLNFITNSFRKASDLAETKTGN